MPQAVKLESLFRIGPNLGSVEVIFPADPDLLIAIDEHTVVTNSEFQSAVKKWNEERLEKDIIGYYGTEPDKEHQYTTLSHGWFNLVSKNSE